VGNKQTAEAAAKQAALDRVPLGAIIPYGAEGDAPPEGYVFADGKSKWPSAPWVPMELRDKPVPDLTGRVLRGVSPGEAIAHKGGKDKIPEHATAMDGEHGHSTDASKLPIKGHTGLISNSPPQIDGKKLASPYFVHDNNKKWSNRNWLGTESDGPQPEGQHVHDLDLTVDIPVLTIAKSGKHQHSIPAQEYFPSYVGVRFIIRVR
jgi:hypothetical protein